MSYQTEPAPPPADETPTNPDGIPDAGRPAVDVLSVEAAVAMLPRLIDGVEAMGRDLQAAVRGLQVAIDKLDGSIALVLREGQRHAQRLSDVERRLSELRCQSGGECGGTCQGAAE